MAEIDDTIGLWSLGDFRPDMPMVRGRTALVHRLIVRLQTPRGRFSGTGSDGKTWGWVNFGTDIAQFLLTKQPPSAIAAAAGAECEKDEQVAKAIATAQLEDGGRRVRLSIIIVDASGPFTLTLDISQARLDLIALEAA